MEWVRIEKGLPAVGLPVLLYIVEGPTESYMAARLTLASGNLLEFVDDYTKMSLGDISKIKSWAFIDGPVEVEEG